MFPHQPELVFYLGFFRLPDLLQHAGIKPPLVWINFAWPECFAKNINYNLVALGHAWACGHTLQSVSFPITSFIRCNTCSYPILGSAGLPATCDCCTITTTQKFHQGFMKYQSRSNSGRSISFHARFKCMRLPWSHSFIWIIVSFLTH